MQAHRVTGIAGLVAIALLVATCDARVPADSPSAVAPSITSMGPATAVASGSAVPSSSRTATASPSGPSTTDIVEAGATRISQAGEPDWVALAGGSAWFAVRSGIRQLDATSGASRDLVPVLDICLGMDVGFGSLWAGDCGSGNLARIDPATASVTAKIPIRGGLVEEGSVGAGEGGLWLVTATAALIKVDPAKDTLTTYVAPAGAARVRAGLGSVWLTVPGEDHLLRIDPTDGSVEATIDVGDGPRFLAVGEGGVWVMNNGDGTVSHVDPDGKVVATIVVSPGPVDGGDIAAGGGFVWARISSALIAKVDPNTDLVVATYGPRSGSGSVAADGSAAWVSAHDVQSVWRLPLH